MRATLYELPPSAANARERLGAHPTGTRVDIVEGDALFDPMPEGHDVVICAGFLHLFDRTRSSCSSSAFGSTSRPACACSWSINGWTHTQPLFGALLAGTYLMLSGDGDTYSVDEARPWLDETGFAFVEHRALAAVTSLVIAEAR